MADSRLEVVLAAKDISAKGFASFKQRINVITKSVFSLQGAMATLAGVGGFGGLGLHALNTARAFERYETQLTTLTGSHKAAQEAMDWITDFTRTTPYELDQVTDSFAKLTAYGLDAPRWMATLGDTASSMGKSLNDAVELFADAVTGEFERLKEFGVRAKQQGDKVTFSWSQNGKDMVLTAKKTQSGISSALGEIFARFKGGMEKQSRTFDGLWSNLRDTFTGLERQVLDAGLFDEVKKGISDINTELSQWIDNNGELIAQKVPEYIDGIKTSLGSIVDIYKGIPGEVIGAAGYGLIGRMLFGGKGAVALAGGKLAYEYSDEAKRIELQIWNSKRRAKNILENLSGHGATFRSKFLPESYREDYDKEIAAIEKMEARLSELRSNIRKGGYVDNDAIEAAYNDSIKGFTAGINPFSNILGSVDKELKGYFGKIDEEQRKIWKNFQSNQHDALEVIDMLEGVDRQLNRVFGDLDDMMEGVGTDLSQAFDDLDIEQKEIGIDLELDAFFSDLDTAHAEMVRTFDGMIRLSQRTGDAIEQTFSDYFFDAFTGQMDELGDYWEGLLNSMKRAFADMLGQMAKQFFEYFLKNLNFGGGSGLSGIFQKVIGLFGSGGSGSYGTDTYDIDYGGARASGGPVIPGTSYMVGERGPELFTPSYSGYIIPNAAGAGGGGANVTVPVTVNNNSNAQVRTRDDRDLQGRLRGVVIDIVEDELMHSRGFRSNVRGLIG